MRLVRMLLLAAAMFLVTACNQASANTAGVWVKVSPTTITAGYQTDITANCGDNANSAIVTSPAFGNVTLQPVAGALGARVTVPHTTPKGTYDVRLSCSTGSRAVTTLTVLGTNAGPPPPGFRGPDTGGGFLAQHPDDARPADRTPWLWLAAGVASLFAAAVLAHHKGLVRLPRRHDATRGEQTVRGRD